MNPQNLSSNPRIMRLSADFGNGSMDLTGILDMNKELSGSPHETTKPNLSSGARNSNEHPNSRRQQRKQQQQLYTDANKEEIPQRQLKFKKPLSMSYSQASNNPKNIGVLRNVMNSIKSVDMGISQHLSQFSSLPIDIQHNTILKYEENGQSCKIMNKPFHFSENDRAYRASMFSQIDMEYEHNKLVLSTGKEWYELSPEQQRSIYDQVSSMGQQNRNILIRCLTIETYYRNRLQYDIYMVLEKYLNKIKCFNDINQPYNNSKLTLKEEILRDIRGILNQFQYEHMTYVYKYIIKIEFMERKDKRLDIENDKISKKKMRKKGNNMGRFVTSSNCIWDSKNDDFIAMQWPNNAYYKPIRPIPKLLNENELSSMLDKNNNNNNNNDNNKIGGDKSVTTENKEHEDNKEKNVSENVNEEDDGKSQSEENENENENNENKDIKDIVDDELEIDYQDPEITLKLGLREKMRRHVSEEAKAWENSFLKPVYCLLSLWALKTYDYFDQNLPKYASQNENNGNNNNNNKKIDFQTLNVNNKDLKDDKQKEKHSRAVSFVAENKIEEGDSDDENESDGAAHDDDDDAADDDNDDARSRARSTTVDVKTDDEYEDA